MGSFDGMARIFRARTLILGGLAAGAVYALRNNPAVKGLLGGGGNASPAPYSPPASPPASPVANVDLAGPPENTSTAVPVSEPEVHSPAGGIDEEAEIEAAAAEAANIGGTPEEYPSEEDSTVLIDEALRPLEEAGEGYAEGQELAEADLIDNAEPAAGDPIEGERALDDVIEAQDDPSSGESEEATLQMGLVDQVGDPEDDGDDVPPPPTGEPVADAPPPPPAGEIPAEEKSAAVWQTQVGDEDDEKREDGTS